MKDQLKRKDDLPLLNCSIPFKLRYERASPKLPKVLTVSWAVEAVARLGGYLEHRQLALR